MRTRSIGFIAALTILLSSLWIAPAARGEQAIDPAIKGAIRLSERPRQLLSDGCGGGDDAT